MRLSPRAAILLVGLVVANLIVIFSNPFARWWFTGILVGGVLVAILLRMSRGDGGL
jgi:hypothetical protein